MSLKRTKYLRIMMSEEELDQIESEQKIVAPKVPLSRYAREKLLNQRK